MKTVGWLLLALGSVAWIPAHAEQGCSDGFYPGGTQPGGQTCVPIPGYGTSGGGETPSEQWQSRWGAIATDPSGKTGIAGNALTKKAAEKAAVSQCQTKGGADCKVKLSYRNACGVLAWGGGFMATASAETLGEASEMALKGCSKDSLECEVFFSDCSYAQRVR